MCRKLIPLTDEQRKLVEENINLVYFAAKKNNCLTDEDKVAFGFIGLCDAAQKYKAEKGAFSTFAISYIEGWFNGNWSDQKYKKIINSGSLIYVEDDNCLAKETYELSEEDENTVDALYNNVSRLGSECKEIFNLIGQGASVGQIASILKISQQKVESIVQAVKEDIINDGYGRRKERGSKGSRLLHEFAPFVQGA